MSKQLLAIDSDLPKPLYTQSYIDLFGCSHRLRIMFQQKSFCQSCGIFLSDKATTRVFKTFKMKYSAFFDPMKILQFTLTNQTERISFENADYLIIRSRIIDFIAQAAERLGISQNAVFLAVHFLDRYVAQNQLPDNLMYLYAATSLMLAAKSIELDEKIPFISKLKRYASMSAHPEVYSFRTEEFKQAEQKLIQCMQWKLQQVTLIDRVQHLLAFGVLFDEDQVENDHRRISDLKDSEIFALVKQIESNCESVCISILKDKLYQQHDEVALSLAIIAYLRKAEGMSNIWSSQLQQLTSTAGHDLSGIVSSIISVMSKQSKTPKTNTEAPIIPTPKPTTPLNNYNSNNPPSQKLHFDQARNKPTLYPSQSSHGLEKGNYKQRANTHHFTYLNFNENHHNSYLQCDSSNSLTLLEVEKKYESKLARYLNDPSHLVAAKLKVFSGH